MNNNSRDNKIRYSYPSEGRMLYRMLEEGKISEEEYHKRMAALYEVVLANMEDKELVQRIADTKYSWESNDKKKFPIIFCILIIISIIIISVIVVNNQNKSIPKSETASVLVYITRTGSKYHRDKCDYLRHSKIKITLEEALEESYSPCSKCNPPRIESSTK